MQSNSAKKQYKHFQLGYFLEFEYWNEALKLLEFQISQRQNNKHYNTLSIFYYERTLRDCILEKREDYFNTKIASSLFYGMNKEFAVYHYVIPKKGLGLRDYVFFTYPARVLYYAVGLYLLRLSQEFLFEVHKKLSNVSAYYGGNIKYNKNVLDINKSNVYYRVYYDRYREIIEYELNSKKENKVIIKLDIENYSGEIFIPLLLEKLDLFIKPSIKSELKFDIFTKEQICVFFEFLMHKKTGIPQSDNNIISGFIGHLFMSVSDFLIDDLLNLHCNIIQEHKIIRYVDDINISIVFKENISLREQGEFTLSIASEIAETLYRELKLRLNLKTRAYHLRELSDEKELRSTMKTFISQDNAGFDYDEYQEHDENEDYLTEINEDSSLDNNPQQKLNKIFKELEKLKESNIEDYFIRSNNTSLVSEEAFREIFDKHVYNILGKKENIETMRNIFDEFNLDLIKFKSFELIIMIIRDKNTRSKLKDFLLGKKSVTTSDADLIIKYLCQNNFDDRDLLEKLSHNAILKKIVQLILNQDMMCEIPGYYELPCMSIRQIAEMPEVIEQMRMRIFNERSQSYSVALNHLLNEIHAICIRKDGDEKKVYNANNVFEYLVSMNIPCETRIKIRNLFDRRNCNAVSHPGSDDTIAWEVTKEEYFDYHRHVGYCLSSLLLS
ncbi:MAG: AbiA family abortive infection protein [Symploca sp. SIO2E6]|nr:AbiA family abortive infection protein [Symploca sp. SIO2E6]